MIFEESLLGFGGVGWLGNLPDSGCIACRDRLAWPGLVLYPASVMSSLAQGSSLAVTRVESTSTWWKLSYDHTTIYL